MVFNSLETLINYEKLEQVLSKFLKGSLRNHRIQVNSEKMPIEIRKMNVPQQTNTSDCGIYLLAFVENLFRKKFDLSSIETWCSEEIAAAKRESIKKNIIFMKNILKM